MDDIPTSEIKSEGRRAKTRVTAPNIAFVDAHAKSNCGAYLHPIWQTNRPPRESPHHVYTAFAIPANFPFAQRLR